jgi:hypothetical protein
MMIEIVVKRDVTPKISGPSVILYPRFILFIKISTKNKATSNPKEKPVNIIQSISHGKRNLISRFE